MRNKGTVFRNKNVKQRSIIKNKGNYSEGSIPRGVLACFFAKIPRHTRQNAITEGDLECILTRNCEGTEQLQIKFYRKEE